MTVTVVNQQRLFKVDAAAFKQMAAALMALARRQTGGLPWREVTVLLQDDAGSAAVNAAVMAHDGPTDVITQRYEPIPGEPEGIVGELFVNVACAARRAPRRAGWSVDREVALYLAHGIDHLCGADDGTPEEYARMRRRELRWLRRLQLTPFLQSRKL